MASPSSEYITYMWIGYTLYRQGGRQSVLNGAWRGRRVGPEDDRVGAGPGTSSLKIITIANQTLISEIHPLKCLSRVSAFC